MLRTVDKRRTHIFIIYVMNVIGGLHTIFLSNNIISLSFSEILFFFYILFLKKDEKVRQQKVTPATLRWSRSITYAHTFRYMNEVHIRVYIYVCTPPHI